MAKLESLKNSLFKNQIAKEEQKKIGGGNDQISNAGPTQGGTPITFESFQTYIAPNGDHVDCGEDYRGRSCDNIVIH